MAPPARGSRPRPPAEARGDGKTPIPTRTRSLRKVPQRTCVACRQTSAKRHLVRVVRAPDGSVTIDPSGKRSGRGAYLCATAECWHAALKRGVLPRALKIESIPEDNLPSLTEYAEQLALRE